MVGSIWLFRMFGNGLELMIEETRFLLPEGACNMKSAADEEIAITNASMWPRFRTLLGSTWGLEEEGPASWIAYFTCTISAKQKFCIFFLLRLRSPRILQTMKFIRGNFGSCFCGYNYVIWAYNFVFSIMRVNCDSMCV